MSVVHQSDRKEENNFCSSMRDLNSRPLVYKTSALTMETVNKQITHALTTSNSVRNPAKFKPFSQETTLFLAQGRPKVNINRDFRSLNRLRYFYGGHVFNDVILLTIVKLQMGWEWLT